MVGDSDRSDLQLDALLEVLQGEGVAKTLAHGDGRRAAALRAWRDSLLRKAEARAELDRLQRESIAPCPGEVAHDPARELRQVLEGVKPSLEGDFPAPGTSEPQALDEAGSIRGSLGQAMGVAAVGSRVPEFDYYGPIRRFFARRVAALVLFLSGIITAHQRLFNLSLIDVGNRLSRWLERLDALGSATRQDLNRLSRVQRLHEERLEKIAHAILRGLEAMDRSHSREHLERAIVEADVKSDLTWLSLAAIEQEQARDELAQRHQLQQDLGQELTVRTESMIQEAEILAARLRNLEIRVSSVEQSRLGRHSDSRDLPDSLHDFYGELQREFRGSSELVLSRLKETYLSDLRDQEGLGSEAAPILDLGCGRGEWLQLLREQGFVAHGVDSNRSTVELCHSAGLTVIQSDALSHLRSLEDGSVGAVSAFHVLEHLDFWYQVSLLEETYRVLRSGGLVLLEQPNPENLDVAARSFYQDPTHVRPVDPALLAFTLEKVGFVHLDVRRLKVHRETSSLDHVEGGGAEARKVNAIVDLLNQRFAAAPDFAVVGRKP